MIRRQTGFTLFEVMVAITILGLMVTTIYGVFAGTAESKDEIEWGNDIYHEARWALDKMSTDFSTAFLSNYKDSNTIFYGKTYDSGDGMPVDEVYFFSFNHFKYNPTARESDQCEVSYYVRNNPDNGIPTLYRREDASPDDDPISGGEIYELAEGVIAFNLRYFDGNEWLDDWDSRNYQDQEEATEATVEQTDEMVNAMPLAVEITLVVEGPRQTQIPFHTKVRVLLSSISLSFAEDESGEGATEEGDEKAGAVRSSTE